MHSRRVKGVELAEKPVFRRPVTELKLATRSRGEANVPPT
jgi:hypothetical protein